MPILSTRTPGYKPQKKSEIVWEDWSGGWNNLYDETELKDNEVVEALNCMLIGRGTITGRWGSDNYFQAGSGRVRTLNSFLDPANDVNQLVALTDAGYLVKKSGITHTVITGASFASGYPASSVQLGGYLYILGGNRELVRYNGTALTSSPTVAKPTGVTATNLSGVSGTFTYGWRINAVVTNGGETLASDTVSLVNLPQDLTTTRVKVSWTAVSTASGVLGAYQIFRGSPGGETFIATVDKNTTTFIDVGDPQSDTVFPPVADTTGGPKANHIQRLDDRLVISGFDADPSLVMISARYPYESRFNWAYGGGYVRVGPNDGDKVVCTSVVAANTKGGSVPSTILVFKQRSTYAMILKTVTIGNYVILDPQYQELLPVGTRSPDSVTKVENDVFFLSPDGVYSVGSEPNFLNEIRSKEISTRIRKYLNSLTDDDYTDASGAFIDHKYILSLPRKKEHFIYDYERRAFMGPWKTPYGVASWHKYFDSTMNEKWLAGADDGYVKEFSTAYKSDVGTAFVKRVTTGKSPFNDWTKMKILELFYCLFRAVKGTVTVSILGENRSGTLTTLKTFNITGASSGEAGYGIDQYGSAQYGSSELAINVISDDFVRWTQLYKTIRTVQIEVSSTTAADNWELIAMRMSAQPLGIGSLSPSTRV